VQRRREALVMRVRRKRVGGLLANHHWLDYASVTTTENFVLCAALADGGTSTLMNAASEPHVQEFCRFMALLGAQIEGIGTSPPHGAWRRQSWAAASSASPRTSTRP
jgi:UDP-N-acetylglucosamine 1-carboxyvinyltransferase